MSRPIAGRLKINGHLRAESPLHVGGGTDDVDTDLPLARDGQGRVYVPGTGLAGALRGWFLRRFGAERTVRVWGFQERDNGKASLALVEDGRVSLPNGVMPEIRDGVGVDRIWGSAAEGIKYDRAVLPRGTKLSLEMTVEIPSGAEGDWIRAAMGYMMRAARQGEIALGAAQTRGLGRLVLEEEEAEVRYEDWSSRGSVLRAIRDRGVAVTADSLIVAAPGLSLRAWPRLEVLVNWRPDSPVMVKATAEGLSVDTLPLVSAIGADSVALVLPGSSLKGAMRAQAERIVRTVLGLDPPADPSPRRRFLKHVDVPLISTLFGAAASEDAAKEGLDEAIHQGRGALGVQDCYARQSASLREWFDVERAPDLQAIYSARANAGIANAQVAHHVAVDRWTGGAAEGLLFSVMEPHGVSWGPMRIDLDLARVPERERLPGVALLLHLLRDLARNRVPVGFGGNRGLGWITVESTQILGHELDETPGLELVRDITLQGGDLSGLQPNLRARLSETWQEWWQGQRGEA